MNPSQRGGRNGLADSAEVSRMDDISAADANEEEGKQGGANANLGAQIATPQVSSKHWRKIRTAVVALAAFRSKRVKAADFERIKLFGEGGSGLVYLVKLKNTSMYFALKVQRKLDLQAKEKRIRRALIEREVLVACAHPFVCSLYTAFQDSRHLYLLMDFCAGGDLTSLIRNVVRRPLREDEARFYVSEIVAALEWVHLHGYVYRDLKPENVLIHESGHIRLGDFGTAERGKVKCTRPMSERLSRVEIERELLESSNSTLTAAAATAGGAMEAMVEADGPETVTEEEDDDGASDEELGNTLRGNSIVVDIDPLLQESNASHVRSKTNDVYPSAFAPGPSRNDGDPAVESPSPDDTGTFPFKCCPSRQKGGSRTTDAATVAPAPVMPEFVQKFSRGRGSVKLNVLLDSQTFIGTADFMAPEMVTGKNRQGTAMDWWALGVMLFEMTLGTLPFNSNLEQSSNGVFRSIVNAELVFPRRHKLSRAAVDLIKELLRKDPAQRLGERKGVGEIKRHAFFANTHWALLAHVTPPFKVPGPDTPGWITSITSAQSRNRHDKMATWTWNVTNEGSRPPETVINPGAFEMARNILDRDSISDDSSQRITEPLERGEGVKTPVGLPKALAASGGGKMTWSKTPKGGNDDGVPSSGAGELYLSEDSSHTAGVSYQTEGGDMSEFAGGSAPRHGSSQAVSLNGSETMNKEEIEYASAAVLTSAYSRAKVMTAENSNGSSFDGYDFNTVRKRGSFTDGKSSQAMPTLSANKSSEY